MNDTYVEVMVDRKTSPLLGVARIVLYALAIVCFMLALIGSALFFVGAIAFALVAYFVLPNFDLEYEYLYVDKEISIDKIMAKEKRKHVMTIDLNNMEVIAPVNSHELDQYKARNLKTYDFTSLEEDAKVYSVVFSGGSNGTAIANIEPNEEMLHAIKNVFPRKVLDF